MHATAESKDADRAHSVPIDVHILSISLLLYCQSIVRESGTPYARASLDLRLDIRYIDVVPGSV